MAIKDLSLALKIKFDFKKIKIMRIFWEKNRRGFTMIEVIIVVAIVGIIASISWATLGGAKKSSEVNNACNQVAAMINKTRNYALSGKQPSDNASAFVLTINDSTVSINSNPVETFTLAGGVSCGSASFSYNIPYGSPDIKNPNITCSVAGGESRTVKVAPFNAVCE